MSGTESDTGATGGETGAQSSTENATGSVPVMSPTDPQALLMALTQLAQQQAVLSNIVQTLAHQQAAAGTSAGTAPATSQPPAVKSLPLPRLGSPDNLTIPQFRDWKQRWEDYATTHQLGQQSTLTQQGILRSALDTEWTMLWNSSRLAICSTTTIEEIVIVMENYLRRRRNPLLDRQEFHRRDQMTNESVDRYFAALKELDNACDHIVTFVCRCKGVCSTSCDDCHEVYPLHSFLQEIRIRDRLICGLINKDMQRKVLAEQYNAELTLEHVLSICTAVENSISAGETLSNPSSRGPGAAAAGKKKSTYKKTAGQQKGASDQKKSCFRCGKEPHPKEECKAVNNTCEKCSKVGHFKKVCRSKPKDGETRKEPPATTGQNSGNVATEKSPSTAAATQVLITVPTIINGVTHLLKWLPDTGADVMIMNHNQLKSLGNQAIAALTNVIADVEAVNGLGLGPVGSIPGVTLQLNGRSYTTTVYIFENVTKPLLSKTACQKLGLIDEQWPLSRMGIPPPGAHVISSGDTIVHSVLPITVQDPRSLKQSLIAEFPEAFNDTVLRPMEGPPMKIELIAGAQPTKRYKAHTIPFHWREQVKAQLDIMVQKDIIESVPVGEPLDWCHPMVVVPKKGSSEPRITVDLTGLNKFVRRPAYPVKVPRQEVANIPPGCKYFTTLDARHGYWQVPLDEESKKLTSFITPWGSFRYKRNVMGLVSAGDEHNRRGDEALAGISNVKKIVEDILLYDEDLETHVARVREVVKRCSDHGITLNAKKLVLAQPEADWCGFRVTSNGYTISPHLIAALTNFPVPVSKTDVRSFCGLVQQFESFSTKITELAAPIRSLLSSSAVFIWEATHQKSFLAIIKELTSTRVLAHFQPGQPLRLETDAAQSKGLGYALWQQQPEGIWKLLQAGSRFVTPTESRYCATEIEMLAVCWAIRKCKLYLLGNNFELVVDHRPLISIINSKTLDEVENPRLQRMKEKLSSYRPQAVWRAGVKHTVVDVFSRHPVTDPDEEDLCDEIDADPTPILLAAVQDKSDGSAIITDPALIGISQAAEIDLEYRRLRELIQRGFPDKHQLDTDLKPYWKIKDDLFTEGNLIFMGSRILVPSAVRPSILRSLHASHQGQERTLRRARQAVFWPGISNDIRNVVKSCRDCAAQLPSQQKEPLYEDNPPTYPFQCIGVDVFTYAGYEYLAIVDRFSGWQHVAKCGRSTTSLKVKEILEQWFTQVGIPEKIESDNGTPFASLEFQTWAEDLKIRLSTSSPHYPQSNGLAESAVKSLKALLTKTSKTGDIHCQPFLLGLMELRNTPRADGRSPAQMVYGAPMRTTIPLARHLFAKHWQEQAKTCDERATKLREKAASQYNAGAKRLSELEPGVVVLLYDFKLKKWDTPAEVIKQLPRGRSYLVRTESGRLLRRNRRFLRVFNTNGESTADPASNPPDVRRSARIKERTGSKSDVNQRSHLQGGHEMIPSTLPLSGAVQHC